MSYDRRDVKGMSEDELTGFLTQKMSEMTEITKDGGLKSLAGTSLEDFQARDAEMTDARTRLTELQTVSKAYQAQQDAHRKTFETAKQTVPHAGAGGTALPSDGGAQTGLLRPFKALGERFTDSEQYKSIRKKGASENGMILKGGWNPDMEGPCTAEIGEVTVKSLDLDEFKATMMTTAGWAPYPSLSPRPPVMTALQEPLVADLIPSSDTNQPAILYYEETAFSDNAAFVAQGAAKPEAELRMALRTRPVEKIAVMLPISEEQVMDIPQVRDYIDGRLTLMVKRAEERGLLNGSGVSPEILGFHNVPNIGSIARGAAEDNPDAILRAITEVNSIEGYANTTGIILNPAQWLAIRLLRTKTGDYIWGHPALIGPATLWGLPVISTNAETAGRALVGDFRMYAHISRRMGLRIDIGYINTDFRDNIQRIRLEERMCLEVYRAKAFCEVTNLNAAA